MRKLDTWWRTWKKEHEKTWCLILGRPIGCDILPPNHQPPNHSYGTMGTPHLATWHRLCAETWTWGLANETFETPVSATVLCCGALFRRLVPWLTWSANVPPEPPEEESIDDHMLEKSVLTQPLQLHWSISVGRHRPFAVDCFCLRE